MAPAVQLPLRGQNTVSEKAIAVLPFVDMSQNKDQEYFSDGLAEELIGLLTRVSELRVPARTSCFYFKGKQATITDIARALNVAHVLEGSVRKSGNTIRIAVAPSPLRLSAWGLRKARPACELCLGKAAGCLVMMQTDRSLGVTICQS
jgi:hypothetical protein